MRSRAYRIAQQERKKNWAKKVCTRNMTLRQPDERDIGRTASSPTPCSCPMCGNPRRHFGNSKAMKMSEYRASQKDGVE